MTQAQGATKLRDHSLDDVTSQHIHFEHQELKIETDMHPIPSSRYGIELSPQKDDSTPYQTSPPRRTSKRQGGTAVSRTCCNLITSLVAATAPDYFYGKQRLGRRVFIGRIILGLLDRSIKRSVLRRTAAGACTYYFYSLAPSEKPGVEHTHEAHQVLQQRPRWDGDSFFDGVPKVHQRFVSLEAWMQSIELLIELMQNCNNTNIIWRGLARGLVDLM
jgi:hypothetical protein